MEAADGDSLRANVRRPLSCVEGMVSHSANQGPTGDTSGSDSKSP